MVRARRQGGRAAGLLARRAERLATLRSVIQEKKADAATPVRESRSVPCRMRSALGLESPRLYRRSRRDRQFPRVLLPDGYGTVLALRTKPSKLRTTSIANLPGARGAT
jgi:hypothetical protein